MTIDVHIDELVLEGVQLPAGAEPRLRRVLEREIARLVARDGLAPRHRLDRDIPALRAPAIATTPAQDTVVLARHISRAVARGLSR